MKKIIVLICSICFVAQLQAQDGCMPEQGLTPDQVVVPPPFTEAEPDGGIYDTACINQPFEFTVTINPPEDFNGATIASLNLNPNGAISNLPTGISYTCNPPNCVFVADTVGCVLLSGTPTNVNQIGAHDLVISGLIVFTSGSVFPISFPNVLIAPGNYFLHVKAEGSDNCWEPVSGTNDLENFVSMTSRPNPFSDWTTIEINSDLSGRYQFAVHDILGRSMHEESIQLTEGRNLIDFDGSNLSEGIYVYSISDGKNVLSKRMIVNR